MMEYSIRPGRWQSEGKNEGSETVSLTIDRAVGACLKGGSDESTVPPEAPFNRHHPCRVLNQSRSCRIPSERRQSCAPREKLGHHPGRRSRMRSTWRGWMRAPNGRSVQPRGEHQSDSDSGSASSALSASAREPFLSGKIGPRLLPSLYLTGCRKLAS